jgi:hypothetical protein
MSKAAKKGLTSNSPVSQSTLLRTWQCDRRQPSCGRCARLNIECVGSGVQRYKFLDTTATLVSTRGRSATRIIEPKVSRSPSKGVSILTSRLVSALQVEDMRYSLPFYIGCLTVVPRRLGANEPLDAATRALTHCFPSLWTGKRTTEMLRSFGVALESLRVAIQEPGSCYSAETLCAMYLTAICQVRLAVRS